MAGTTKVISNAADSGSTARVAYDLAVRLSGFLPKGPGAEILQKHFDLYEQCYELAAGRRGDAKKVLKE